LRKPGKIRAAYLRLRRIGHAAGNYQTAGSAASFREAEDSPWIRIGVTLAMLAAFGLVLERVGFLLATFLVMVILLRSIEAQDWRKVIAVALATALISYRLFAWLLVVCLTLFVLYSSRRWRDDIWRYRR